MFCHLQPSAPPPLFPHSLSDAGSAGFGCLLPCNVKFAVYHLLDVAVISYEWFYLHSLFTYTGFF